MNCIRSRSCRLGLLRIALAGAALLPAARGQAPEIGFLTSATFESAVTPDGLGTIFGSDLSDGVAAATTLPLPPQLGSTSVSVCASDGSGCLIAPLLYVSPGQINFYVPAAVPFHVTRTSPSYVEEFESFTVTVAHGAASAAARFDMFAQSPSIFAMGYDCDYDPRAGDLSACGISLNALSTQQVLRGAIVDGDGQLVSSGNPMRIGQYYSIFLTGLGVDTGGQSPFGVDLSVDFSLPPPLAAPSNSGAPFLLSVPVTYAGESTFAGLQQINYNLTSDVATGAGQPNFPVAFPCGELKYEFGMTVTSYSPNDAGVPFQDVHGFSVPVLIEPGDVPCR